MTENEALCILNNYKFDIRQNGAFDMITAISVATSALKEIQQYREVGTVEECREAVEKQTTKAPYYEGDGYDNKGELIYDTWICPNCGKNYEVDYDDYKHCPECGQRLDIGG